MPGLPVCDSRPEGLSVVSGRAGTARWKRLRRKILDRDGWRCRKCGKAGRLEVDHIVPVRDGGIDDPANLRILCGGPGGCHAARHRRKRTATEDAWDEYLAGFSDRY